MANEAVAGNCVYCGRVLFANGHGLTNSNRLVCNGTCQIPAELNEKVIW